MLGLRLGLAACAAAIAAAASTIAGWRVLEHDRAAQAAARAWELRAVASRAAAELGPVLGEGRTGEAAVSLARSSRRMPGVSFTLLNASGVVVAGAPDGVVRLDPDEQLRISVPVVRAPGERVGEIILTTPPERSGGTLQTAAALADSIGLPLMVLMTGVAGLVGFLVAGRITTPLQDTALALCEFAAGRYRTTVRERGAKAARRIARTMNSLAPQLASMSAQSRFVTSVLESMVDSLIVVDGKAQIQAVNPATLKLLGYSESELVGRSASLICLDGGTFFNAEHLGNLLRAGATSDHEVVYVAKDGRRIPVSLSGSAIRDGSGAVAGYVCIGTDIASRKAAEADREQLNKQLVSTSRQAGMAEVATGVLHNVGNVLNSVNVAASMAEAVVRRSKMPRLTQLAELVAARQENLTEFLSRDERGRELPRYLVQLAAHLSGEQRELSEELRTLTSHVGHIRDIVSMQQSISRVSGVTEEVRVGDVLDDALRMVQATLVRDQITLERDYSDGLTARLDKHRALQILVNLMANAAEATRDTPERQGLVRVRAHQDEADPAMMRIEVTDNGGGIAPENLTRIFTHGFTTKKNGHGFGLHASALAAKELGGSLAARSDGPKRGATFTLLLPRRQEQKEAAPA